MAPRGNQQYTLVGFNVELEWKPLFFTKPLPQNRVCGACGIVRPKTALLPCGHTLCRVCFDQCAEGGLHICPLDDCECKEEDVEWRSFAAEELLRREVKCWNEWTGCTHMMSAAGIATHFRCECEHHCVSCPKCSGAVLLSDVIAHMKSANCNPTTAPGPDCDEKPGQKNETAMFTSSSLTFQQGLDEVKKFLGQISSDIKTHGDRLNEVAHGLNNFKQTFRQELAAGIRDHDHSLTLKERATTAQNDGSNESSNKATDIFIISRES